MAFKEEKEKVKKVKTTKADSIREIKDAVEKKFGKGSIFGAKDTPSAHEYISTGSVGLDLALGIGGLPKGRIVEIFGPESSGKTTMCLEVIVQAHKNKDSYCAIIDAEHAIDLGYAEKLGVDLDRLEICQPDHGDQGLEIAAKLIESGEFDVVVIDSVAALVPKAELEGEMGDSRMGLHARLMSQALRKLVGIVSKSNTILIFTNQMREKIGVMFGNPETTTGGNALKFYASVRMDVRRSVTKENSLFDGDLKVGNQTKIKVIKNKVAPPFRECEFDILFGEGIDTAGELLDLAVDTSIIVKSGSYFAFDGKNLGQGREAVKVALKEDEKLSKQILDKVLESFKPKVFAPTLKEKEDAGS